MRSARSPLARAQPAESLQVRLFSLTVRLESLTYITHVPYTGESAMKFDKDLLLKHRFWIMVGLSVPFAALAIMLLVTTVSGGIEAERKKLQSALNLAMKVKDIHKPQETEEKKVEANILVAKETEAWRQNFQQQESLFGWPRKMQETYRFADGLFATEVHLLKLPAEKSAWPEDDKAGALRHGTLVGVPDEAGFEILDRNGKKHSFLVTPQLQKNRLIDERNGKSESPYQVLTSINPKDAKEVLLAVSVQKARYFTERLTANEQIEYKNTYLSQIPAILRLVDPLRIETSDGKPHVAGVVQLRSPTGWSFDPKKFDEKNDKEISDAKKQYLIPPENSKFIRFVARDWNIDNDISDEAWIAQEDLWIQTEIYRLVRVANDSISSFVEVSRDAKTGDVTYQNPYFIITAHLKDTKTLQLTIANRLERRQKIEAMKMRIRFGKMEPEVFPLVTESKYADPLEPRGDPKGGDVRVIPVVLPGNFTREHHGPRTGADLGDRRRQTHRPHRDRFEGQRRHGHVEPQCSPGRPAAHRAQEGRRCGREGQVERRAGHRHVDRQGLRRQSKQRNRLGPAGKRPVAGSLPGGHDAVPAHPGRHRAHRGPEPGGSRPDRIQQLQAAFPDVAGAAQPLSQERQAGRAHRARGRVHAAGRHAAWRRSWRPPAWRWSDGRLRQAGLAGRRFQAAADGRVCAARYRVGQ